MDGLLIDSEPIWREVQRDVFEKMGILLSDEEMRETTGLRGNETIEFFYHRHPWTGRSCKEVENEIVEKVIETVREKGVPHDGVKDVLEFVKAKGVKVAVASSSSMHIIKSILGHLDLEKYFDALYSAEFEEFGKPHPAVYLTSAKMLNIPVGNCLAFEDSFNGLLAAKAARMKCVCVPDELLRGSAKLGIADVVLPTLAGFDERVWEKVQ